MSAFIKDDIAQQELDLGLPPATSRPAVMTRPTLSRNLRFIRPPEGHEPDDDDSDYEIEHHWSAPRDFGDY